MKRLAVPVLLALVAGLFASGLFASGLAQSQIGEVLYLSDSSTNAVGTYLYRVNLDQATHQADLTLLPASCDEISFNQVDALACTPDGGKLYAIDKYGDSAHPGTGKLGYCDVGTASWYEVDYVKHGTSIVPGIVLAAFSPGGILYAASENTDSLYTVDKGTAAATLVGQVVRLATGATVNVQGADLVFAADGTLYLWANGSRTGAPRGLYELTLPATVPGPVYATHLGEGDTGSYFTGLAIRANGWGDLVGSTHEDEIFVVDKTNASTADTFEMYLGGSPYNYEYGDMTAGPLVLCTKTIGYWKNHSWDGATVSICGDTIDESEGKEILWNARGNNFSMFFAQLIAAKLNTNNATGIPTIDDAEAWLCAQGVEWDSDFASKQQKREAAAYWEDLDAFNNQYECE